MKLTAWIPTALAVFAIVSIPQPATATVPYTENFGSDAANWYAGDGVNVSTWHASGGPGNSTYISSSATGFLVADDDPVVVFRGEKNHNASNHAFEGNWLTSAINQFEVMVRHDAPISLPFFVRFSTPSNFPGTAAVKMTPVTPNTWTKLKFDIVPSNINVELFPEGPPSFFTSTFSNVGNIQVGYSVPTGFGTNQNSYTFDMDQALIRIVPEPASWLLFLGGSALVGIRRRRHAS